MDISKVFGHLAHLPQKECDDLIAAVAAVKLNAACEGKEINGKPAGLALIERYIGNGDPRLLLPQEAAEAIQCIIEARPACVAALTAQDLFALSDEGFYSVIDGTWCRMFDDTRHILVGIQQKIFADEDAGYLKEAV